MSRKRDCRERKYQDSWETRPGDSLRGRGTWASQLDKPRVAPSEQEGVCLSASVSAVCVVYFVVSVILGNRRAGPFYLLYMLYSNLSRVFCC